MRRPPMLIDCDPGVDDSIALLAAAHLTDLVGVTTVNGNVGIEHTTHNALGIIELTGTGAPVHRGADRPLVASTADASYVHGPTGLGEVELTPSTETVSDDAAGFICEMAREVDGLELVAVGPLTNIANALSLDPSLPSRLGGFTIMGGAAHGGNVTATSEFNVWADPEAAAAVFAQFPHTTMVGLDVTHRVLMTKAHRDRLADAGSKAATTAARLLDFAIDRASEIRDSEGAPIHDASAVMAVVAPELFSGLARPVSVELDGSLTRGMTVVDARPAGRAGEGAPPANATVMMDADPDAVIETLIDAIIALGTRP